MTTDENVSLRAYIERIFDERQMALELALRGTEQSLERARGHIEAIFEEHRKAHNQKHVDDERALEQAREAINLRLEKLNELRAEVLEDRGEFIRREVHASDMRAMGEKLDAVRSWQNKAVGAGVILTLVAGTIGALVVRLVGS